MHKVYKNIDNYNSDKEIKVLIVFNDIIVDMIKNSLVFITQSYFKVPKDVRLNTSHFFIVKIPNKRELQQIAANHSSDINTGDFVEIY